MKIGTVILVALICCGMSRAHWEQGESDWHKVDLVSAIRELEYLC